MFEVQYRCVYREFWYQDLETFNGGEALQRARQLALQRYVRILGLLALPILAQGPPAPSTNQPANPNGGASGLTFAAVGGSWGPKFAGMATFGYGSASSGIYSFTTEQTSGPIGNLSLRTGIMTCKAFGSAFQFCEVLDVGASSTSSVTAIGTTGANTMTTNTTVAGSGRGVVIWKFRPQTYFALDAGIIKSGTKSTPTVAILFGRTF
jgi:hypothetical protein